jgi:CHAT domain-containing protein
VAAAVVSRGGFTDYWGRLPATEYESQVACDLHADTFGETGERLLLQGAEPTEERLKHEVQRHSALHLATHGFFQPEGTPSMWESALNEQGRQELRMSDEAAHLVGKHPGLLSGLVCAGANERPEGERDDGYLTAEEVGWLDLSRVELVVLSACETGLGRAQSGEGLIGLRRAFRTAGARTVISSLWSVKDESTAELMRDFYRNLWQKGMGRLEALRAAQLAMLRRNRIEHGEALPSTWGAFVLSGEWR